MWFCLTKVSGKNHKVTQTYIGFVKNCKLVPKVVKKTKVARYPRGQKSQKITNILELKNIQFQV